VHLFAYDQVDVVCIVQAVLVVGIIEGLLVQVTVVETLVDIEGLVQVSVVETSGDIEGLGQVTAVGTLVDIEGLVQVSVVETSVDIEGLGQVTAVGTLVDIEGLVQVTVVGVRHGLVTPLIRKSALSINKTFIVTSHL